MAIGPLLSPFLPTLIQTISKSSQVQLQMTLHPKLPISSNAILSVSNSTSQATVLT